MINAPMSPREIQVAQFMVLLPVAAFVGGRFLPPRLRRPAGVGLMICYLATLAAFIVYVLFR
jgi:hypothetical protein